MSLPKLRALGELDEARRVFADPFASAESQAIASARLVAWRCQVNDFEEALCVSWRRLLGEGRSAGGVILPQRLPLDEHGQLYTRDGEAVLYEVHPAGLHLEDLQEILRFAQLTGLEVYIDGAATWAPGKNLCIGWSRPGEVTR